jgi:hypothetical protein
LVAAISLGAFQNAFSKLTLVKCPEILIDLLMTGDAFRARGLVGCLGFGIKEGVELGRRHNGADASFPQVSSSQGGSRLNSLWVSLNCTSAESKLVALLAASLFSGGKEATHPSRSPYAICGQGPVSPARGFGF